MLFIDSLDGSTQVSMVGAMRFHRFRMLKGGFVDLPIEIDLLPIPLGNNHVRSQVIRAIEFFEQSFGEWIEVSKILHGRDGTS